MGHESSYLSKGKVHLVFDFSKYVPCPLLLTRGIGKFLIHLSEVCELMLVTDSEFLPLLACWMSDRITLI
jgi:hypothetical protein